MESLIDTGIVTEVLKVAAKRQRPNRRTFWRILRRRVVISFGSLSSIWSVAYLVVADEYHNNPWIKYGAYAAAVAVSMSRELAEIISFRILSAAAPLASSSGDMCTAITMTRISTSQPRKRRLGCGPHFCLTTTAECTHMEARWYGNYERWLKVLFL